MFRTGRAGFSFAVLPLRACPPAIRRVCPSFGGSGKTSGSPRTAERRGGRHAARLCGIVDTVYPTERKPLFFQEETSTVAFRCFK